MAGVEDPVWRRQMQMISRLLVRATGSTHDVFSLESLKTLSTELLDYLFEATPQFPPWALGEILTCLRRLQEPLLYFSPDGDFPDIFSFQTNLIVACDQLCDEARRQTGYPAAEYELKIGKLVSTVLYAEFWLKRDYPKFVSPSPGGYCPPGVELGRELCTVLMKRFVPEPLLQESWQPVQQKRWVTSLGVMGALLAACQPKGPYVAQSLKIVCPLTLLKPQERKVFVEVRFSVFLLCSSSCSHGVCVCVRVL